MRTDCEAFAGQSTLNRPEHTPRHLASKYYKIDCGEAHVDALLVDLFLGTHERAPRDRAGSGQPDIPLHHGAQENRFFRGYYHEYCDTRDLLDRAVTARDIRSPVAGGQQVPHAEPVDPAGSHR